ncbi:tetratricopeptide repeat protein [Bacillus salitolerans]|uniref:Tetratricopeptide repeat protein n=1 Tax=Bacillus salitolerans TaxID=1437434 RepID=A0ABW4LU82_9BACI
MDKFEEAQKLKELGELTQSMELFKELVCEAPDNASYQYHCACAHDRLGFEREAVPYYEAALQLGLHTEENRGLF